MSGDRATRKVQRWAERSGLGCIRHVEANRPGMWFWGISAVICLPLFTYFWLDGDMVGFGVIVGFVSLIVLVIAVYLGGEKIVVLDQGLLIGSFSPGLRPYVIPFACLDARSVRTAVCTTRPFAAICANGGPSLSSRTSIWSRRQVTFVAIEAVSARKMFAGTLSVDARDPGLMDLWVFSARTGRRQRRVASAILDALSAVGVAGVEISRQWCDRPRRIRATPQDADYLAIPWFRRSPEYQPMAPYRG